MNVAALMADRPALRDWAREHAPGSRHASATCRMGRTDDSKAATDLAGRVIGVNGLSIADASIMACVVNATTSSPS